jgi:hypothetical protein
VRRAPPRGRTLRPGAPVVKAAGEYRSICRLPWAWGDKHLPAADSLLVKVTTGLEGWGEAFSFRTVMSAKLAIDENDRVALHRQGAGRIAPLTLDVQKTLHVFGPPRKAVGSPCRTNRVSDSSLIRT